MSTKSNIKFLTYTAVITAIYVVMTVTLSYISYGPFQFRFSEVLVLLAFIDKKYIPGLVLGCFLANISSPLGPIDWIVGTSATFLSVFCISRTKNLFIATLWPTIINGLLVGGELYYLGFIPETKLWLHPLILTSGSVAIGEFVVVSIAGYIIFKGLLKNSAVSNILKITR